jgi:hypothetical protein
MQKNQLLPNELLVFSGPGGRNITSKIIRMEDEYLQLEIIESELKSRKTGTLFRVPVSYVMECGLYKLFESSKV